MAPMKRCCGRLVEILYTQIIVAIFASAFFTIYKSSQVITSTSDSRLVDQVAPARRHSLSIEARLREEALDRLAKEAAKYEDDDAVTRETAKKKAAPKPKADNKSQAKATTVKPTKAPSPAAKKGQQKGEGTKGKSLQSAKEKKYQPIEDKEPKKDPVDNLLVQPDDFIFQKLPGESAPIVVEEMKLIFFAQAKVGCTVWKMLLRRMMGYKDYRDNSLGMPHAPELNGLRYLYHYNRTYASHIMQSPDWIRAIVVRDPKERFLSAYLDKAVEEMLFVDTCCNRKRRIYCDPAPPTMHEFLDTIKTCRDSHWDAQSSRMEAKYWPLINFVGHLETAQEDAKRLLKQLHGWEQFGLSGWGPDGNLQIFASKDGLYHSNNAKSKVQEYIYPELEREVEAFYEADYKNSLFKLPQSTSNKSTSKKKVALKRPIVEPRDWIYRKSKKEGEAAPVVIESHKLIFFVVPHVADHEFKRLFRRMVGREDWKTRTYRHNNPEGLNEGLTFLSDFNLTYASHIMTAPDWTRAMFVRDPKERFVLAYTQTAVIKRQLLHHICCMKMPRRFCLKGKGARASLNVPNATEFLEGISTCKSTHWDPITERFAALNRLGLNVAQKKAFDKNYWMKSKYWRYLNFVGSMDSAAQDAKRLLQRVGAWTDFGQSGWGDEAERPDSFFTSTAFLKHELRIKKQLAQVIADPQMERRIEELYMSDYNNPHFNITRKFIYSLEGKTYRDETKALEALKEGSTSVAQRQW